MSEDDFVIHLERCNRCGWNAFERLPSHAYCTNCNYSPDADVSSDSFAVIPDWAIRALKSIDQDDTDAGIEPVLNPIPMLSAANSPGALST